MKHILIQWTYFADIVSVPDNIADNLRDYQISFDKWIGDKNNRHKYWVRVNPDDQENIEGLCFGSDAFVCWLNDFIIKENEQKAYFIKKQIKPNKVQKKLPTIYF